MHELGICFEITKIAQKYAADNKLSLIKTITVQIGEASTVVPAFLSECFPAATDGTPLKDTELVIEVIKATGYCLKCSHVYNLVEHNKICPFCGSNQYEMINGREFLIKSIQGI